MYSLCEEGLEAWIQSNLWVCGLIYWPTGLNYCGSLDRYTKTWGSEEQQNSLVNVLWILKWKVRRSMWLQHFPIVGDVHVQCGIVVNWPFLQALIAQQCSCCHAENNGYVWCIPPVYIAAVMVQSILFIHIALWLQSVSVHLTLYTRMRKVL